MRLDRFLPPSLGFAIPATVNYTRSHVDPELLTGTDLRGADLLGLRRPESWSATYSVQIRRSRRGTSWLAKGLLDPLTLRGRGHARTDPDRAVGGQGVEFGVSRQLQSSAAASRAAAPHRRTGERPSQMAGQQRDRPRASEPHDQPGTDQRAAEHRPYLRSRRYHHVPGAGRAGPGFAAHADGVALPALAQFGGRHLAAARHADHERRPGQHARSPPLRRLDAAGPPCRALAPKLPRHGCRRGAGSHALEFAAAHAPALHLARAALPHERQLPALAKPYQPPAGAYRRRQRRRLHPAADPQQLAEPGARRVGRSLPPDPRRLRRQQRRPLAPCSACARWT